MAPSLNFYILLFFWHCLVSLLSQCWTRWKLNASAEKHTSGNDLSASAARVMNSANRAYHRLRPLVLIATATTRPEKRWALLPGLTIDGWFSSEISSCVIVKARPPEKCLTGHWSKTSVRRAITYIRDTCSRTASVRSKLGIQSTEHLI